MTMEAGKQQHTKYVNNKNAALLSLNNKLSELQVKYDCLLTKSEQLESQMTYIESTAAGRTLQLGQIRMSVTSSVSVITPVYNCHCLTCFSVSFSFQN